MLHDKFDIEKFKSIFPVLSLRRQAREFVLDRQRTTPEEYPDAAAVEKHVRLMEPSGEIVTSPFHIAVVEQLREEAAAELHDIPREPTDVFVLANGEPTDRRVTKIGGVPFWPRKQEWPMTDDGQPMRFLAQFCFADSGFIFQHLPGQLLSIFCSPSGYQADKLQFHWLGPRETDLVQPEDIPVSTDLTPVFGVLHRSYDYAELPDSMSRYRRSHLLYRIQGTKIGGLPSWIQSEEDLPGRFLCALGSVDPEPRQPYPFVNMRDPIPSRRSERARYLMLGDVGSLYFFLDDDGEVRCTDQCY